MSRTELGIGTSGIFVHFLVLSFFFLLVGDSSWVIANFLSFLLSLDVVLYIFQFILESLKHLRVTIVEELAVGVLH